MNKRVFLLLSLLASVIIGCSDQKASATRHRWIEIKTATEVLIDAISYTNEATSIELASNDGFTESLARAASTVNACQTFNIALVSQNTINVDPRLNEAAEKLIRLSESLLSQTKRGQDAIINAKRILKELETEADPQKVQQLSLEAAEILKDMNSAQQIGAAVLEQIGGLYHELESLRLELNKQYSFELPQIKWIEQNV